MVQFRSLFMLGMAAAIYGCGSGQGQAFDGLRSSGSIPSTDSSGSANPGQLTLALKFVAYLDESGNPVLSKDGAQAITDKMNQLYAQCNVRFRTEEFIGAVPSTAGLSYATSSMDELDKIRGAFDVADKLVVVETGAWNHSSMGAANAWTNMPGSTPSGAVIDGAESANGPLIAHEIGHYLNLDHVSDGSNLMNPIIYPDSSLLSASQCQTVREAAVTSRRAALRT